MNAGTDVVCVPWELGRHRAGGNITLGPVFRRNLALSGGALIHV